MKLKNLPINAKLFGFGQKTNIQLQYEIPGLVPTPEWKKKTFNTPWQPGETLNVVIGQGAVLVTALQMVLAYNAIGRSGLMVKPFLVKHLRQAQWRALLLTTP